MTNHKLKCMHLSPEERQRLGNELFDALGKKRQMIIPLPTKKVIQTICDVDPKTVFDLVDRGADVNFEYGGVSIFNQALKMPPSDKKNNILKYIIIHGVDVGHRDALENTPLINASFIGVAEAVACLLKNGADVNAQNGNGLTPIMWAAWGNKLENVDVLLSYHPNLNLIDQAGDTVLHHAVQRENLPLVQKLVDAGADVRVRNEKGQTPLDMAISKNAQGIVIYIKEIPKREKEAFDKKVDDALKVTKPFVVKRNKGFKK